MLEYFERPEIWGPDSAYGHPVQRERADTIHTHMPEEVQTILDVGCGDGTVTNRLADWYAVTGVDLSRSALQHVTVPTERASADALPFPDRSFDALVLAEVLEHLPEPVYDGARQEAARVAADTIVITVPNREMLREAAVRCPRCRSLFSPWFHQRSFHPRDLADLFPGFELDLTAEIGPSKPRLSMPEVWIRSVFRRPTQLGSSLTCPHCGLRGEGRPPPANSPARRVGGVTTAARAVAARARAAGLNPRIPRPRARPVWLLGRWKRS